MTTFSYFLLHSMLLCCISLPVSLSRARFLGNETDRLALLAFKSQITQDPFKVTGSWNDSNRFCEWEGVACSRRHERVTVLNLTSKGLVGSISPHIGNLSFLRSIDLHNNSFHGDIPQEIGLLSRLQVLNVRENSLAGEIPENISLCSKLTNLDIGYNSVAGKIPMELGSLQHLVELILENNKLTGGIPPFLGNLTSLQTLAVAGNNFGGSIPGTLDRLKRLEFISLDSNKLSGMIPHSFYNLSTLEIISVPGNQLSGNLPLDIGHTLPNLVLLFIGANQFSGPIPSSLVNASKLKQIDISSNRFTGDVPPNLGNLKNLKILTIGSNYLGNGKSGDLDFLHSLTNCSNLQQLGININKFGGMLPSSIANFSNQLSLLFLDNNRISGNIPTQIVSLQNLIYLDLYSNYLTGSIPMGIGNLQNLQKLSLGGNQLTGHIPSSVRNMSHLFYLDLSYNFLEGSIASSLDNQFLQRLDLSYNKFTGEIPRQEIGLSSNLITLTLTNNSLIGPIPTEVDKLKNLQRLDVSENKLSGEIPSGFGSCLSLEYIYIQGNSFQGPVPSSLSSLKGLQVLDISRNNITGKIPKELEKLSVLRSLNLSFNNLEGEVPNKGIFQNGRAVSVVGNYNLCGGIPKLKLPKCNIKKSKRTKISLTLKVTFGVLFPLLSVVALLLVIFFTKRPKGNTPKEQLPGDLRRVSYNDLRKATNDFSSGNLIGVGKYGSVYRGVLQQDEASVAVKVLNLVEHRASKTFMAECEALRAVRHRNILKILTVCSSPDFKALVLEFMPNGSLERWLHPSSNGQDLMRTLNLFQRVDIAIDVASALDYLHNHCERPIVHCDLKSSNILLSSDMTAHVADFGLAKFLSKHTSTSNKNESTSAALRGTIGYIPPEYGMGAEVSKQGDVYSYGVLLLEMFTGKRPTDCMFKDGVNLHMFSKMALPQRVMDIIDMHLLSEETPEEASKLSPVKDCLSSIIRIGVACSEEVMSARLDIKDVIKEMHSIKQLCIQV